MHLPAAWSMRVLVIFVLCDEGRKPHAALTWMLQGSSEKASLCSLSRDKKFRGIAATRERS